MDRDALDDLGERARQVARRAYAPASRFTVGAALLAGDGRVFTGCNVEIASFGLTVCAERNAVFHAVAEGVREFAAIAIYTPQAPPGYPCGACRQVLAEFCTELRIRLVGDGAEVVDTSLEELFPHPFRFDNNA